MNRRERRRLGRDGDGTVAALAAALARHEAGDFAAAEQGYRAVLLEAPGHPDAIRLLGEVLTDRGKPAQAIDLLQRLARLRPDDFAVHYSLGNAHRLARAADSAIASYRQALALKPGFAGAQHGLGLALRLAEREAEAALVLRAAVAAMPGWAAAWQDLGVTLGMLGNLAEAEAALRRAVALQPNLAEARRHLAALGQNPVAGSDAGLAARAANPRTPVAERIDGCFALGRLADNDRSYDTAFGHFAAGNALLRAAQRQAGAAYDPARISSDVDRLIATFTADSFRRLPTSGLAEETVFIVGMPRAGSTLFEQIAASHRDVFGAGEQPGIGAIAARLGWQPSAAWSPAALAAAAAKYLAPLRARAGAVLRIIDKMPDNVFQLGLITALFPAARIIFCARDPRDTGLSCFFQRFAQPYGFDTSLQDCVHRLGETERLANHWRAVLPLRHITLAYETMVGDLEGQARRLIAFLGLDWDPACLDFHRNPRPVRTASWSQVRAPIHDRSIGRWRHYRKHLAPLLEAWPDDPHDLLGEKTA